MQLIDGTETVLKQHVDKSTREIDRDTINDFLVYAHEHHWTKERQLP